MLVKQFNPHEATLKADEKATPRWLELRDGWAAMSLEQLRASNAKWFAEPIAFELTAPCLWTLNMEFTRRGVAPMWRGVPRFIKPLRLGSARPGDSERRLGDAATKGVMKRWIDMEWLRVQLGARHKTKYRLWQDAFADELEVAIPVIAKVNAVWSHGAGHSNGKAGTKPAHDVVDRLSVPSLHRLGLTGLIDRDSGEKVRNMEKRLKEKIGPLLAALKERPTLPLTAEEVERRLLYCQAIELAVGSPTTAALIFKWMTGEVVTRQTMHEMRAKIAEQCGLKTRAWQPRARC